MNNEKIIKVLKGSMIAGGGAILAYLGENISQIDFGKYTLIVGALASILINAIRLYLQEEQN